VFRRLPVPAHQGPGPREPQEGSSELSLFQVPQILESSQISQTLQVSRVSQDSQGSLSGNSVVEALVAEGGALQVTFRFEPFILALDCRSPEAASRVVGCAIRSGFRESGEGFWPCYSDTAHTVTIQENLQLFLGTDSCTGLPGTCDETSLPSSSLYRPHRHHEPECKAGDGGPEKLHPPGGAPHGRGGAGAGGGRRTCSAPGGPGQPEDERQHHAHTKAARRLPRGM